MRGDPTGELEFTLNNTLLKIIYSLFSLDPSHTLSV